MIETLLLKKLSSNAQVTLGRALDLKIKQPNLQAEICYKNFLTFHLLLSLVLHIEFVFI